MSEHPSNSEFLRELAKGAAPGEWLWVNHLDGNPNESKNWAGEAYGVHTDRAGVVDTWGQSNTYVAACSLKVINKVCRRTRPHFGRLLHLPVDDVDLNDLLATPSYVLETSPGNFQAGYFIDADDPDAADERLVSAVLVAMAAKGLVSVDKSGNNAVRYTRLPHGQNHKPRDGGHWDVRVVHWAPQVRYSMDDAAGAVGIDLDEIKAGPVKPAVEGERQAGAGGDGIGAWTADIIAGAGLHDSINRMAGHHIALGVPPGAVVDTLRSLMNACTGPRDDRWQARYDDIGRAVDTAVAKFKPVSTVSLPEPEEPEEVLEGMPAEFMNPGGMMQVFIDWNLRTAPSPSPTLALASAIALVATVAGRQVMSESGLRTNMYGVCIAGTGMGKEHGRKCVRMALEAANLEHLMGGDELASAQALIGRITAEPNTLLQPDEYGKVLQEAKAENGGTHKVGIATVQMKLYGLADSKFLGTEYADRKLKPREDVHFPCLNINATTTAETLYPAMGSADITSGFANRLDFYFEDREPTEQVMVKPEPCPPELAAWLRVLAHLSEQVTAQEALEAAGVEKDKAGNVPIQQEPRLMAYSAPARLMVQELNKWVPEQFRRCKTNGMAPLFNRVGERSIKKGMVFTLSGMTVEQLTAAALADELEINPKALGLGIGLTKWQTLRMERELHERAAETPFGRQQVELLRVITKAGVKGLTARELGQRSRLFSGLREKDKAEALSSMASAGDAQLVDYVAISGRMRSAYVAARFTGGDGVA